MDNNPPQNAPVNQPAPSQPAPTQQVPMVPQNPGSGAGIASFVLAVLGLGLFGLIVALISRNQSNKAGMGMTGLAKAGLIISIIEVAVVTIAIVFTMVIAGSAGVNNAAGS